MSDNSQGTGLASGGLRILWGGPRRGRGPGRPGPGVLHSCAGSTRRGGRGCRAQTGPQPGRRPGLSGPERRGPQRATQACGPRASALDLCDEILVIEEGVVTACGSPGALHETGAFYRRAIPVAGIA